MAEQRPMIRWRQVVRDAPWFILALLATGATPVRGESRAPTASQVATQPSAGCSADSIGHDKASRHTIRVGASERGYILDVPAQLQPHVPVPLVFDFHGFGDSASRLAEVSAFHPLATRDGFIVVYPEGLPVHLLGREAPGWEIFSIVGNRDLAFTAALLERLEADYCIDQARVFATGFSNGAFFSHLLGCTMADRFAAIAPVSGGLVTPCAPARPVAVIMHHGTHDPLVDVKRARQARDAWLRIDHCPRSSDRPKEKSEISPETQATSACKWYHQCRDGAAVAYCENDGGHRWPPDAAARIWEFFRHHPLTGVRR